MIGKRLKYLRELKRKSQQEVCSSLNIEQSTLANYENDKRVPKIDILIELAQYYDIPTDYLLGVGAFKNWDLLLKNKSSVIKHISTQAQQLALALPYGLDDISFAKLVYAFDVNITTYEDGAIGICATNPIPTYTEKYFSDNLPLNDAEKEILSLYRNAASETKQDIVDLLSSFCLLKKKERIRLLGKCYDLECETESVAADSAPLRKTGTDRLGK